MPKADDYLRIFEPEFRGPKFGVALYPKAFYVKREREMKKYPLTLGSYFSIYGGCMYGGLSHLSFKPNYTRDTRQFYLSLIGNFGIYHANRTCHTTDFM